MLVGGRKKSSFDFILLSGVTVRRCHPPAAFLLPAASPLGLLTFCRVLFPFLFLRFSALLPVVIGWRNPHHLVQAFRASRFVVPTGTNTPNLGEVGPYSTVAPAGGGVSWSIVNAAKRSSGARTTNSRPRGP